MSEERFKTIEETIRELSAKVAHLDTSFAEVSVSLKDYANWTKQLEHTIRNLDDTVQHMNNSHQRIPFERITDIQNSIAPIREVLNQHEVIFLKKSEANRLTSVAVFFLSAVLLVGGWFISYVMQDIKEDILSAGNVNKILIEKNTQIIQDHDSDRKEMIRSMHTHAEAQ